MNIEKVIIHYALTIPAALAIFPVFCYNKTTITEIKTK